MNNGRQPITIKRGDPTHVEFISREGEPSPYKGDYMFQYMSDDEVDYTLELSSNTSKVSSTLRYPIGALAKKGFAGRVYLRPSIALFLRLCKIIESKLLQR